MRMIHLRRITYACGHTAEAKQPLDSRISSAEWQAKEARLLCPSCAREFARVVRRSRREMARETKD